MRRKNALWCLETGEHQDSCRPRLKYSATTRKRAVSAAFSSSFLSDCSKKKKKNPNKINTAVTFSYLWLFLTQMLYIQNSFFPPIWEHDLCVSVWSLCFFMSGFCYLAMYSIYITTESHVHLREPVWSCVSLQPYLCRCSSGASSRRKQGFTSKPTCKVDTSAHSRSSRPYCIYVSVLYYVSPLEVVVTQPSGCFVTGGRASVRRVKTCHEMRWRSQGPI